MKFRLAHKSESYRATVAALALRELNLVARSGRRRHIVYPLKTQLIRWLYQNGYCTAVHREQQTLACRNCNGANPSCRACSGTSVYRTHQLYRFSFVILRAAYVWHQPVGHVDWPVAPVNAEPYPYLVDPFPPAHHTPAQRLSLIACLCAAMESLGLQPIFRPALDRALNNWWYWRITSPIKHAGLKLRDAIARLRGDDNNNIPF